MIEVIVSLLIMIAILLIYIIHYRRRLLQEETDKAEYRYMFMLLRDRGIKHIIKNAEFLYLKKYLDEIEELEKYYASYSSKNKKRKTK